MTSDAARVSHAAVTFEIKDGFGGLTRAMLTRTSAYERVTGDPALVLTVGHQPDLDTVRADLTRRGLLVAPERLRNLWEEVSTRDDLLGSVGSDASAAEPEVGPQDEEIRRPDGSLMAVQRWRSIGPREATSPLGDVVTDTWLWRSDGTYLGHLPGSWPIWRRWVAAVVDELPGRVDLLVDSATVADGLGGLDAPRARLAVVLHNNHLRPGVTPPVGVLNRWRRHLLQRADRFDALVFLTEQQRQDAVVQLGELPQAVVVPNVGPDPRGGSRRRPRGGVVLAALIRRKRVDHAIRAAAASGSPLTVYGEGDRRRSLEQLVAELGAPVSLPGYADDAGSLLGDASYLVLTSTGEGLPMVLLEAMSAGCVPIVYDVPYGPRDVVTPEVDGYLVPMGDVDALVDAIRRFEKLSGRRQRRMRAAAVTRSEAFAAAQVVARWQQVMAAAGGRRVVSPTAEEERLSGLARFEDPYLLGRVVSGEPGPDGRVALTLEVDVLVEGRPDLLRSPVDDLAACLVDRTTGARTPIELIADADRYGLDLDPERLRDASLLLTGTVGDVPTEGLVAGTVRPGPWQGFAPDRGAGPVLVVDAEQGLRVEDADPKAIGRIDESVLTVAGATALELRAGRRSVKVAPDAEGRFVLPELSPGRWRVLATVGGKAREIAWSGPLADTDAPARVDLTPKGYLRLVVDRAQVVVTGLDVVDGVATLTGTTTGEARVRHGADEVAVTSGTWSLPLHDLRGVPRVVTVTGSDVSLVLDVAPGTSVVDGAGRQVVLVRDGADPAPAVALG